VQNKKPEIKEGFLGQHKRFKSHDKRLKKKIISFEKLREFICIIFYFLNQYFTKINLLSRDFLKNKFRSMGLYGGPLSTGPDSIPGSNYARQPT
jgi:hypothetical protein